MFLFLIAIRHPENSTSYQRVEELLNITLESILGQTYKNIKVIIVCNRPPRITTNDERVIMHTVNFPPRKVHENKEENTLSVRKDKATKYLSGLLFAKKFNPKYVYIVDADDWINKGVAEYISNKKPHDLWYCDRGCFVDFSKKEYSDKSGLHRYCGSTFVYNYNFLFELTKANNKIDENSDQARLLSNSDEKFVLRVLSNHDVNYKFFNEKGSVPKKIPIRAVCWVQNNGENVYGKSGGNSGLPINQQFTNTFNVLQNSKFKKQQLNQKLRNFMGSISSQIKAVLARHFNIHFF